MSQMYYSFWSIENCLC